MIVLIPDHYLSIYFKDTVRKAADPIESLASILINMEEKTIPKTATKSKKAKKK